MMHLETQQNEAPQPFAIEAVRRLSQIKRPCLLALQKQVSPNVYLDTNVH